MPVPLSAVVLAAGVGKRMRSARPKVLHEIAGRPMVVYPVEAALGAGASRVVVVLPPEGKAIERALADRFGDRVAFATQPAPRGTGDAVRQAGALLGKVAGTVLVLYGDAPLVDAPILRRLARLRAKRRLALALLTCEPLDPTGYGRIVRDAKGRIVAVREHRDASPEELRIAEVNPGFYAFESRFLWNAIARLRPNNEQGELYLTDVVARAARAGRIAAVSSPAAPLAGVNDRAQLAQAEAGIRARIRMRWMREGVTFRDPGRTYVGADATLAPDVVVEPGCIVGGRTRVGRGTHLGAGSVLVDVELGEDVVVFPYTVATESKVGDRARLGPFAHLRPGTVLAEDVHVGNFVETKKTSMGEGSKANHLAYLGDGVIGRRVNVGAGTIFCNYDGFGKFTTAIEDDVFIGSDSQLVAPVTVGAGAYVGTGSTITDDVPPGALAIGRARQVNKAGYARQIREKLSARAKKKK